MPVYFDTHLLIIFSLLLDLIKNHIQLWSSVFQHVLLCIHFLLILQLYCFLYRLPYLNYLELLQQVFFLLHFAYYKMFATHHIAAVVFCLNVSTQIYLLNFHFLSLLYCEYLISFFLLVSWHPNHILHFHQNA